jgi:hypothetical protein
LVVVVEISSPQSLRMVEVISEEIKEPGFVGFV